MPVRQGTFSCSNPRLSHLQPNGQPYEVLPGASRGRAHSLQLPRGRGPVAAWPERERLAASACEAKATVLSVRTAGSKRTPICSVTKNILACSPAWVCEGKKWAGNNEAGENSSSTRLATGPAARAQMHGSCLCDERTRWPAPAQALFHALCQACGGGPSPATHPHGLAPSCPRDAHVCRPVVSVML